MGRPPVRWLVASGLLAASFLVGPSPARGGSNSLPDLKIAAQKTGPFLKNDVYNLTADKQTVKKQATPGKTRRFYLKVQNDGDDPDFDGIALDAAPGFGCFTVKFYGNGIDGFDSSTDYTSFFNSEFGTAIDPGATQKWRVEMTASPACTPGDVQGTVITGHDYGDTPTDVVKTKLKVK